MKDTIRLGFLKQLTEYLSTTVTVANGYNYTLTGRVFRGRGWFGSNEPLPMVSILEGAVPDPAPITAGYGQDTQADNWVLGLQGWAQDDADNPTDPGHYLLGDLKHALGLLRRRFANLEFARTGTGFEFVGSFEIEAGVARPSEQLSEHAYCWLRIVVQIIEEVDQPYLPT